MRSDMHARSPGMHTQELRTAVWSQPTHCGQLFESCLFSAGPRSSRGPVVGGHLLLFPLHLRLLPATQQRCPRYHKFVVAVQAHTTRLWLPRNKKPTLAIRISSFRCSVPLGCR